MPKEIDMKFFYEVYNEIHNLKWYFYKFSGINADEAMQRTLYHTLMHFDAERGNLSAYIKKLAREITKENGRTVLVDFIENTLADNTDNDEEEELQSTVDTGSIRDFSTTLINEMELNIDRHQEVVNIALEFMDKFVILCDALIRHDTSTKYYPDTFIKSCLAVNAKCTNFNSLCLDIYMEYKEDFEWFLSLESDEEDWKESDFAMINNNKSKRIRLVNSETNEGVLDADTESWKVVGNLNNSEKRIIKVYYEDLWEYFCDLIDDTETNEMKFIIGNSYILRTFGGSQGVLNTDLFNFYDLVRYEIVTNVIIDTRGRVLNIGSENIYLICNSDMNKAGMNRTVHGHPIELQYVDITDSIH